MLLGSLIGGNVVYCYLIVSLEGMLCSVTW